MRLFLISNTYFGHKHHKDFVNYFTKSFVPFIKKYSKPDDILIHMGNLFNSKSININVLNDVYNIFEELSNVIDIKFIRGNIDIGKDGDSFVMFKKIENIEVVDEIDIEGVVFYNSKEDKDGYNGYYRNFTKKRIGSPYQIDDDDKDKKRGFMVYDVKSKKLLFQENKYSKRHYIFKIDTKEDLDKLNSEMFKDKVHVEINKELYNDYENKINVILSQYDVNKVSYYNVDKEEDDSEVDSIVDIETNLRNEIQKMEDSETVMKAFENILELYEKKFK